MSIETRIERNKSLKSFSTFGIGGPARFFITIRTIQEMLELKQYINKMELPFWVIGKGSNSLFDDRGFDGLIIHNKIDFIEWDGGTVHVGGGYSFSLLGAQTARKKWSGLEFASGIPGTVGGAVYMNAGANKKETADTLTHVGYITQEGEFIEQPKDHLNFSYRTSSFQGSGAIIVSARFQLTLEEKARKTQLEIIEYRTKTQPYGDKSAGCVFRNPAEISAGALIEQCGLKGKQVGGAEVSMLHGNFIVNRGNATAEDVLTLAQLIKETIYNKTGHTLEMEVRPVPYRLGE